MQLLNFYKLDNLSVVKVLFVESAATRYWTSSMLLPNGEQTLSDLLTKLIEIREIRIFCIRCDNKKFVINFIFPSKFVSHQCLSYSET